MSLFIYVVHTHITKSVHFFPHVQSFHLAHCGVCTTVALKKAPFGAVEFFIAFNFQPISLENIIAHFFPQHQRVEMIFNAHPYYKSIK